MRIDLTLEGSDIAVLGESTGDDSTLADLVPAGPTQQPGCGLRLGREVRPGTRLPAATRTDPAGPEVRVVGGPDGGRRAALGPGAVVIGRDPGGAGTQRLVVQDPSLSRRHARVEHSGHRVRVVDLGSTHRTRLDGLEVAEGFVDPGNLLALGDTRITVERAGQVPAAVEWRPDGTGMVNRSPSIPSGPPVEPIERVTEPEPQPPGRTAWLAALLPALLGAGLAWRLHNPEFLLFMVASPLMLLGSSTGERMSLRRRRRSQLRTYRRDRTRQDRLIAERLADEARIRRRRLPDPTVLADIAALPAGRLWEGTAHDGLVVRAGLATLDSELTVRDGTELTPAGSVDDVPVAVDLAGGLGVCAPPGARQAIARWLVCQVAARFSPAEVEIAVVVDDAHEGDWTWARWLPHLHETGRVARTPEQWNALAGEIDATVAVRTADRDQAGRHRTARRLVLVVDAGARTAELARLAQAVAGADAVGISALWLAPTAADLPGWCVGTLRSVGDTGARARLTTDEQQVESVLVDAVGTDYAETLARDLAPLVDAGERSGGQRVTPGRLLDLLGLRDADPADLGRRWTHADFGPTTVIGSSAHGPVELDLDRDGPHALIAGTTGSGKSELLQTLVAGLAAGHPPDRVSFVLVDYKGGAAFGACARLPHVTGVVTDLDHHLTRRALRSLGAELTRRERLLAEAGVSCLGDYQAATELSGTGPLPRLVIVVDEFAALAEELPDFVKGLVAVAQRGRSLGVHLILATQRPGGAVSPEIRANSALRIALRVTDTGESTEVIGTADAAHITRHQPGRGYVARDGDLTEVQVARIAVPVRRQSEDRLRVVPLGPWRTLPEGAEDTGDKTDLELLCDASAEAWRRTGRRLPAPPWLDPLPAVLDTTDLPAPEAPDGLALGVVDLPDQQCRRPYELSLTGGGVLVSGAGRSGRSSLLLSIALGTARRDPTAEIYAVAPCAGPLTHLEELPQCGTVARDAASIDALVSAVAARAEQRAQELTLTSGATRLSPLVLLVDDYETVVAAGEEYDLGATVDRLHELLRAADRSAATVVVAGGRGVLVPRLTGIVSERLVLRMADPADYGAAGLRAGDVPAAMPPGRALRVVDGAEVALARPHPPRHPGAAIRAVPDPATTHPGGPRSPLIRIRSLPTRVDLTELPTPPPGALVLGPAGPTAATCLVRPWTGAARLLVAGPSRSGRSTTLVSLASQADRGGMRVVALAPNRSPLARLADDLDLDRIDPDDGRLPGPGDRPVLVVVDDAERLADSPAEAALLAASQTRTDLSLIVALRTEDLAVSFRGLAAQLRRDRVLVLLQPGPADGELLGLRGRQIRTSALPGRGLLLTDPAWGNDLPAGPVPVQVARPPS